MANTIPETDLLQKMIHLKHNSYKFGIFDIMHRSESEKRAIIDSQLLKVKRILKTKSTLTKKGINKKESKPPKYDRNYNGPKIQIIEDLNEKNLNELDQITSQEESQSSKNDSIEHNSRQGSHRYPIQTGGFKYDIMRASKEQSRIAQENATHKRFKSNVESNFTSNKLMKQSSKYLHKQLLNMSTNVRSSTVMDPESFKTQVHNMRSSVSMKKVKFHHQRFGSVAEDNELLNTIEEKNSSLPMKKFKSSMDYSTDFASNNIASMIKLNVRPIGTPYIDKRPPLLQVINPVNQQKLSYSVILQSPLNLTYKETFSQQIQSSNSFVESIKPPIMNALDIYNKTMFLNLRDKSMKDKNLTQKLESFSKSHNTKVNTKTQQTFTNQLLLNSSMTQDQINFKVKQLEFKQHQQEKSMSFFLPNQTYLDHQTYKEMNSMIQQISENDPQAHIKALKLLKDKMNDLLKDNQKQIEQMNDDSKFYLECRDLVMEVFSRPDQKPQNTHNKRRLLSQSLYTSSMSQKHIPSLEDNHSNVNLLSNHNKGSMSTKNALTKENTLKNRSMSRIDQTMFQTQNGETAKDGAFDMIPLIYRDKSTNKTVVKFEASSIDQEKSQLVKQLYEVRVQKNQIAKVLEKVLSMYDVVTKERFEKEKEVTTPRTITRMDQKVSHLQQIVQLCIYRFNFTIKEKTRVLDNIFQMALPIQLNPLAKYSDMAKINNDFLNSIPEDNHAFKSKINTIGLTNGDLNERMQYLSLMHKSLNIFHSMLARKVQQVQTSHIKQRRFSPRNCVMPSSMESQNLIIEDFDLGKNYFDKTNKLQRQSTQLRLQRQVGIKKQQIKIGQNNIRNAIGIPRPQKKKTSILKDSTLDANKQDNFQW
eukprot:403339540